MRAVRGVHRARASPPGAHRLGRCPDRSRAAPIVDARLRSLASATGCPSDASRAAAAASHRAARRGSAGPDRGARSGQGDRRPPRRLARRARARPRSASAATLADLGLRRRRSRACRSRSRCPARAWPGREHRAQVRVHRAGGRRVRRRERAACPRAAEAWPDGSRAVRPRHGARARRRSTSWPSTRRRCSRRRRAGGVARAARSRGRGGGRTGRGRARARARRDPCPCSPIRRPSTAICTSCRRLRTPRPASRAGPAWRASARSASPGVAACRRDRSDRSRR